MIKTSMKRHQLKVVTLHKSDPYCHSQLACRMRVSKMQPICCRIKIKFIRCSLLPNQAFALSTCQAVTDRICPKPGIGYFTSNS